MNFNEISYNSISLNQIIHVPIWVSHRFDTGTPIKDDVASTVVNMRIHCPQRILSRFYVFNNPLNYLHLTCKLLASTWMCEYIWSGNTSGRFRYFHTLSTTCTYSLPSHWWIRITEIIYSTFHKPSYHNGSWSTSLLVRGTRRSDYDFTLSTKSRYFLFIYFNLLLL